MKNEVMQRYTVLPQIKYFHLQKNSPTFQFLEKPSRRCCAAGRDILAVCSNSMRRARISRPYLSTRVPSFTQEGNLHGHGVASHHVRVHDFLALQASWSSMFEKVTLLEDEYQ